MAKVAVNEARKKISTLANNDELVRLNNEVASHEARAKALGDNAIESFANAFPETPHGGKGKARDALDTAKKAFENAKAAQNILDREISAKNRDRADKEKEKIISEANRVEREANEAKSEIAKIIAQGEDAETRQIISEADDYLVKAKALKQQAIEKFDRSFTPSGVKAKWEEVVNNGTESDISKWAFEQSSSGSLKSGDLVNKFKELKTKIAKQEMAHVNMAAVLREFVKGIFERESLTAEQQFDEIIKAVNARFSATSGMSGFISSDETLAEAFFERLKRGPISSGVSTKDVFTTLCLMVEVHVKS